MTRFPAPSVSEREVSPFVHRVRATVSQGGGPRYYGPFFRIAEARDEAQRLRGLGCVVQIESAPARFAPTPA